MSQKKKRANLAEDNFEVDISSLIDVCFLLLIFFLVTSTIETPENDLLLNLPAPSKSVSNTKHKTKPLILEINKQGAVFEKQQQIEPATNNFDKPRKLERLLARIKFYISGVEGGADKAVIMIQANQSNYQHTIDVLNVLASQGVSKISFINN